jgi:hypothetical protein
MRDAYLKEFELFCERSGSYPVTEGFGNGFTTHFAWPDGKVTQGFGWTKEESIKDFEDAICIQYEGMKL